MAINNKKSTKAEFDKKAKPAKVKTKKKPAPKKSKKKEAPYTSGGSFCSTMSRLNKRRDFTPGESW